MPSKYDDSGSSSSSSSDSEDEAPTQTIFPTDDKPLSLLDDVNELILPPSYNDEDPGETDSGKLKDLCIYSAFHSSS